MTSRSRGITGPVTLLVLIVLVWAVSWPAIKIGVAHLPPFWFGTLRYAIATLCCFGYLVASNKKLVPPRADLALIAVSGILQMAVYSALTGLALTILPPGRASVLAFATPIWVVPLAAWRLHERISRLALLGVGAGLTGVIIIASPALHPDGYGQIAAYAMLLGASAAWAIAIVFVRAHRMSASAVVLAPWQMLIACSVLGALAWTREGPLLHIDWPATASLAYVGPVATAFAYWAMVVVGRRLRARTVAMTLLATPCTGILLSAVTLGEHIDQSLIVGLALVRGGIVVAARST